MEKRNHKDLKKISDKVWQEITEDAANIMLVDVYDFKSSEIITKIEEFAKTLTEKKKGKAKDA